MKYLIALLLAFSLNVNAQKKNEKSGKLSELQLEIVQKNFNWDANNKVIILNFLQPKSNCHYDNYSNINKPNLWWKNFYSKIDLTNVENKFVYSDSLAAKKIIDYKKNFSDKDNFLLNNFFNDTPYCFGIIVINSQGFYKIKGSEYLQDEVKSFLKSLKEEK